MRRLVGDDYRTSETIPQTGLFASLNFCFQPRIETAVFLVVESGLWPDYNYAAGIDHKRLEFHCALRSEIRTDSKNSAMLWSHVRPNTRPCASITS